MRYTGRMSSSLVAEAVKRAPTFLSVGTRYRDVLDPERTVVPQTNDGLCRVYFGRQYVGKVTLPTKLFDPTKCDCSRYGFLPVPE